MKGEAEEHRWACLEPGVIEKVLCYTKQSPRWRREAPALRLLNRHWRIEVDRHVFYIHPHHSRPINAQDLPALLKFPYLQSLNATRFVWEYEAGNLPSIGILSRLGRLSSLRVESQSWTGIGVAVLRSLHGVSSLALETGMQSHVPEKDLKTLSRLPLRELSIRCPIQRMGTFFRNCHSLVRLDAQVLPADYSFPFDVGLMNGLTSLKLSFRTTNNNFELPDLSVLSTVTTLVEVDLGSFCCTDLDWMIHLSALRTVKSSVAVADVLSTAAFLRVLQRLSAFYVRCLASVPIDLGNVIHRASQLRTLSLNGVKVDCDQIKANLTNLESLAVHKCKLQNSQHFFSGLGPLKCLGFQCQSDPFSHLRLGDADLSRVSVLKLSLREVDSISVISRLSNLVTLGLRTPYPLSLHALSELGSLPSLIEFGVSPPFPESAVGLFLKCEVLGQLDILYLCDESSIFNASSLQLLRDRVPQLKIETGTAVFDSFMTYL